MDNKSCSATTYIEAVVTQQTREIAQIDGRAQHSRAHSRQWLAVRIRAALARLDFTYFSNNFVKVQQYKLHTMKFIDMVANLPIFLIL